MRLAPCAPKEAAQAVAQMFLGFPQVRPSPDEARSMVALYVGQVAEFPIWAVRAACGAMLSRSSPFPPSAGELRAAVAERARWAMSERRDLLKILDAKVVHDLAPEDREGMQRDFRALAAEIGNRAEARA